MRIIALLAGLIVLAAVPLWLAGSSYRSFVSTPLDIPPDGAVVILEPGLRGTGIVALLAERELTRPGWRWRLLMRLEPRIYRAGEYRLEPGMTPPEVLARLASGQVVQHRLTLVEGWTFRQVARALDRNPILQHRFTLSDESQWPELLDTLGIPHLEGWFLPETYSFTRGDTDLEVLIRAHRAMRDALNAAWAERDAGLPLQSPYELLILASIIEKETALDSERGQIAGVFVRRLQKGMRLQTDPTIIYGLGDAFDGNIRRSDLETDTPYNTYTREGLPPTPIALPGQASLQAAAHPAPGDALYFVADGNGGHTFSVTLQEHQAAVDRMLDRK
jgi:UPF0755 protein